MDVFLKETGKKTSLFAKFNDEADKIREWKAQTDFILKLKDQKLSEMSQIIDTLRARLSQSQKELKVLNFKMQQEEENKQDIVSKNSANRELCYELKKYVSRMNSQLEKADIEKADLRACLDNYKTIIGDLTSKFESISTDTEEKFQQKLDENNYFVQQLHLTSLDFQKKIDDKHAEIFDMKSLNDELHQQIDEMAAKLSCCQEARVKLQMELNEKNNSLEQALTSMSVYGNKCANLEKEVNDIKFINAKLESDTLSLNKETVLVKHEREELGHQIKDLDQELQVYKSTLSEKVVELNSLKTQLDTVLDKNMLLKNENISLLNMLDKIKRENEDHKLSFQFDLEKLNEELSKNVIDIIALNENVSILKNANEKLEQVANSNSEETNRLMQELSQKESVIWSLRTDNDILKQKLLEACEEKAKIEESMKMDFESKLLSQETKFEADIKEKKALISSLEQEQISRNQKIDYLESAYERNLRDIDNLKKSAESISMEKIDIENLLKETTTQLCSERDDYRKELGSYQEFTASLQKELSRTAANLAFSLNKCKTDYDNLMKVHNFERTKLESEYKHESERLKKEVAHYKNLVAQAMQNRSKKGNQTFSRSQECLVDRDFHSQDVKCDHMLQQKISFGVTSDHSNFVSWIDSDPIFDS